MEKRDKRKRDKRIIIPFSQAEIDDIEEWWHRERLASRAEAIRTLIVRGLAK